MARSGAGSSQGVRRIAIFARWPEPGRVKTRLSPALPPALACDLYRAMLEDALASAAGCGADEAFVYWADAPGSGAGPVGADRFQSRIQRGPDLGERLGNAFTELLSERGDQAVIVGADCPALDAARLRDAFAALAGADLVLGPARDGGYYLVGLERAAPELFRGISWGSTSVLEQTLERTRSAGLKPIILDPLEDLDTPEDLVRLLERTAWRPDFPGIRSLEALRAIGLLPASG